MRRLTLASVTALALTIAAGSIFVAGFDTVAQAKNGGNGGGNGNGNGGGSASSGQHSQDNNGGQALGRTRNDAQDDADTDDNTQPSRAGKIAARATKEKDHTFSQDGLSSLKRNYRAYLNSSDPRMAPISAYAVAYARYELENGTKPSSLDPTLGDAALEKALASSTKTGSVNPAELAQAKRILGVGAASGKIDQIRNALKTSASVSDDPRQSAD